MALGRENPIELTEIATASCGQQMLKNGCSVEGTNLLAFLQRKTGGKNAPGPIVRRPTERRWARGRFAVRRNVVAGGENRIQLKFHL